MKECKIDECDSTDLATRSSMCKSHHREYTRAHYKANKDSYIARNKRVVAKVREFVLDAKDVPCADCGVRYPFYVMDFDHREGVDKLGNIAHMASLGLDRVKAEVAKCDVVCSNCHRERTYRRGTH